MAEKLSSRTFVQNFWFLPAFNYFLVIILNINQS